MQMDGLRRGPGNLGDPPRIREPQLLRTTQGELAASLLPAAFLARKANRDRRAHHSGRDPASPQTPLALVDPAPHPIPPLRLHTVRGDEAAGARAGLAALGASGREGFPVQRRRACGGLPAITLVPRWHVASEPVPLALGDATHLGPRREFAPVPTLRTSNLSLLEPALRGTAG
jgi:hypothetical protein